MIHHFLDVLSECCAVGIELFLHLDSFALVHARQAREDIDIDR